MAAAEAPLSTPRTRGLLDLEQELTCQICMQILYQPLTLLDCLHTFCGSCLKVWFMHEVASSRDGRSRNPYSCPSCRASVRDTRPDAKVTTLLEMWLSANPESGREREQREEIGKGYKVGEDVLPQLRIRSSGAESTRVPSAREDDLDDAERDRRMLDEVREMSIRDMHGRRARAYERGVRHRQRSPQATTGATARRQEEEESRRSQARQIEHQSSLRSLLSTDEVDSTEMEEEILRQIREEGLLEGIDLQNMDLQQEDELSERIAEAYRRRHGVGGGRRSRSQDTRGSRSERNAAQARALEGQTPRRGHGRSVSGAESGTATTTTNSSHPPVSRPHLLEAYPTGPGRRSRTSSETRRQTRRQTSPATPTTVLVRGDAARSATDLSDRPRSRENRTRRPSDVPAQTRRPLIADQPRRMSENAGSTTREVTNSTTTTTTTTTRSTSIPTPMLPSDILQSPISVELSASPTPPPARMVANRAETTATTNNSSSPMQSPVSTPTVSTPTTIVPRTPPATLYLEPSLKCERCGKPEIQYDLHANCTICNNGNYNICHRCYRESKGCLQWYGFGHASWRKFQQQASPNQEHPHSLIGHKYRRPRPETISQASPPPTTTNKAKQIQTSEDPTRRLESGAFCYLCHTYASFCFWKCDYCNEGEWGYCTRCVNSGKHCTHPLLPIAQLSTPRAKDLSLANHRTTKSTTLPANASFTPITSPRMVQTFPPSNLSPSGQYRPLTLDILCTICRYAIPPFQDRYHCNSCSPTVFTSPGVESDYNICTPCYVKLEESERIPVNGGARGWRRCPRGHRMVVVVFEEGTVGQRRIVVRELVGGHALKEDELDQNIAVAKDSRPQWSWFDGHERRTRTTSNQPTSPLHQQLPTQFPPDGGFGMRVQAVYTWLPQEGRGDELSFPRGAEITEVEDINGDWYVGSYAGGRGLLPSGYVRRR